MLEYYYTYKFLDMPLIIDGREIDLKFSGEAGISRKAGGDLKIYKISVDLNCRSDAELYGGSLFNAIKATLLGHEKNYEEVWGALKRAWPEDFEEDEAEEQEKAGVGHA